MPIDSQLHFCFWQKTTRFDLPYIVSFPESCRIATSKSKSMLNIDIIFKKHQLFTSNIYIIYIWTICHFQTFSNHPTIFPVDFLHVPYPPHLGAFRPRFSIHGTVMPGFDSTGSHHEDPKATWGSEGFRGHYPPEKQGNTALRRVWVFYNCVLGDCIKNHLFTL